MLCEFIIKSRSKNYSLEYDMVFNCFLVVTQKGEFKVSNNNIFYKSVKFIASVYWLCNY